MNLKERIKRGIEFISRQERAFKINLLRVSSQNFFLTSTQQYQSLYITGLGADPMLLGLLNSVGGFAGSIVTLPTGWLADRYGIRKIFLLATPFVALAALFFALALNWLMVIPAIIIMALATRMLETVCPMVCGSCLKSSERATGMQLCDTVTAIPSLFSPVVGAVIITNFGGINVEGIRPLYYLQSFGLFLIFLFVYRAFRDPHKLTVTKNPLRFVEGLREVFNRGTMVKRWMLFRALSNIPWFVSAVYIPLYAAEIKNADQFVLGGMATASMLLPILLSIAMGKLADTVGRKKVIYLMTPLYCSSCILLIFAWNPTMLLLSGVLQGFFMLGAVTEGAMTAELVPVSLLGRWYGLLGLLRGVVSMLAPLTAGIIWSIVNPESVFLFLIATQLLKLIIPLSMPETLTRAERR